MQLSDVAPSGENVLFAARDSSTHLLVICDDPWWMRSLESIFSPLSYSILRVADRREAELHLTESLPDAVLVHAGVGDSSAAETVRSLLRHGLNTTSPILLVSDGTLHREERMAALRAGAWECLSAPLDAEELLLKVETFLRAKRDADRALQAGLTDFSTGLYSVHGILRWLRELGNTAQRYRRPLGCAVFTHRPPEPAEGVVPVTGSTNTVERVAGLLTTHARTSDVVGRLNRSEFIVLAPETDRSGIVQMAERFIALTNTGTTSPQPRLCAGCYAVDDLESAAIQPVEVIVRATMALRRIQNSPDRASVAFFQEQPSTN